MRLDEKSKVIVTGGAGFLGRHIVKALEQRGVRAIVPRHAHHDLRTWDATHALVMETRPDLVIHSAWTGGGIGFSREFPATMARDNILMATHLIEACRLAGVDKFVGVGSICSYPKFTTVPFREEDLWLGYPEETNAAYGLAKKMMLVLTQAYRQQFSFNGVHLLMVNLYGPHDNFDLGSGHVIPAMIRKFVTAKQTGAKQVTLWGDGSPTREFIYVTDAAEAIVLAAERYDSSEPVNIGSGQEISIRDLATMLARMLDLDVEIVWDVSKPNGQPRRGLDVSKARDGFGFQATVSFEDGLRRTIAWYESEFVGLPSPGAH